MSSARPKTDVSTMPIWVEKSVDKLIQILQNDILKKKIQILVLEPFLHYCIELVFPYVILVCCVIGVMILILISILAILIYRTVGLSAAAMVIPAVTA